MTANAWNNAASQALCMLLDDLGSSLVTAGAWGVATGAASGGAGVGAGLAAIGAGGAAHLVYSYGCTNDPNKPPANPSDIPTIACPEVTQCGWLYASVGGGQPIYGPPSYDAKRIGSAYKKVRPGDTSGVLYWFITYTDCNDVERVIDTGLDGELNVWIEPIGDSTCVIEPPPVITDPGPFPPITVIESTTNCTMVVTPLGFVDEGDGRVGAAMSVAPAPAARATGGVIGGCNFEPTVVYLPPGGGGGGGAGGPGSPGTPGEPGSDGGGSGGSGGSGGGGGGGGSGDGPISFPDPGPGDGPTGTPLWFDALVRILTGAIGVAIGNALDDFFATEYPANTYRLVSVCEKNAQGEPFNTSVEVPIAPAKQFDAVISRLDALIPLLQGQKDFKQPICPPDVTPVTGDPVTINFESAQYSPFGNNRLRKRFVYFDQSGSTLEQTTDHWRDFVWQAGGVAVFCKGTDLGKPQVWAATEEEGKRVINHAAAITGADMSKAEWIITSSKDPRYGVTGEMHVMKGKNGTFGITKRGKPNGLPPALG